MRRLDMDPLGKVLDQALRNLSGTTGLEARAVILWPEIVGPQVARATEATNVRGGALQVTVRSSEWCTEISFLKHLILGKYRKHLGEDFVKDLRCTVGKVRGVAEVSASQTPPAEEVRRIRLPQAEIERIAEASESSDPELSQAISRALTREAQLRVWRLEHGAKACSRCGAAYRNAQNLCPACRQDHANKDAPL